MKSNLQPSTQEVLAGLVERVTFHNAENGFCVLRAKARGHRDLVTAIGHAATICAGEWITTSGEWINDRAHGQQFKARFLKTSAPSSIDGIEKYLGSGMIRGIGPVYAKKMVKAFGEKVFDVIEAEPDRLREVTGIGAVRAKRITDAWAEQKIIREIMVFLHSNGVGTARAVRIFKTYRADAVHLTGQESQAHEALGHYLHLANSGAPRTVAGWLQTRAQYMNEHTDPRYRILGRLIEGLRKAGSRRSEQDPPLTARRRRGRASGWYISKTAPTAVSFKSSHPRDQARRLGQ